MTRSNRHLVLVAAATVALMGWAATTHAAITVTKTLVATDSTFVDSVLPNTNFGFGPTFDTGRVKIKGNTFDERFGYNLFDLSVLPEGAEVKTAILRLFLEDIDGITGKEALILYSTTTEWNESGLTWNTQPNTWATKSQIRANKFFEDYAGGEKNVWTELDLLALGQAKWWTEYLENANKLSLVQGMSLGNRPGGPLAGGPDEGFWLFDRTDARPELVITYEIPEPVTSLLVGIGGLTLLKRRRTSF